MGISLAPAPETDAPDPLDPTAPKKQKAIATAPGAPALGTGPLSLAPPLPTEYPSAPSTTGTPQNRLELAKSAFDTFSASTAPQYAADLRLATQAAAGKGQIGSGGLRTTYGNLANQRALSLDTQKQNLINAATTGTIADQQAAEANRLASYTADTSRLGVTGNLALGQGQLSLAKENAATSKEQFGQSLDLQKTGQAADIANQQATLALNQKAQDIDAQYKAGTLTLAQKNQALAELQNQQQYGLATGAAATQKEQFDKTFGQSETQFDKKYALDKAAQDATIANQTGQLQLAKDQLAQTGAQFGLSLAQQKDLATLADKTQNRQLDISGAQGQNSLLLELARILGTKDLNIDPTFLDAISKALGIGTPQQKKTVTENPYTAPGGQTTDTNQVGTEGQGIGYWGDDGQWHRMGEGY